MNKKDDDLWRTAVCCQSNHAYLEVILEEHITDTQAQCRQKTSDVVGICEMCEQLSDEFCAIFYRATATGPAVGRAARWAVLRATRSFCLAHDAIVGACSVQSL